MANKKAQQLSLGGLPVIAVILVVAVLAMTYTVVIVGDVQANFKPTDGGFNCNGANGEVNCTSAGYNVSKNGLSSFLNISDQFNNIGTVLGAGLIITILLAAFAVFRFGNVQIR